MRRIFFLLPLLLLSASANAEFGPKPFGSTPQTPVTTVVPTPIVTPRTCNSVYAYPEQRFTLPEGSEVIKVIENNSRIDGRFLVIYCTP
jgi:hypothetical protein